jgi:iron complex outermembrane recepter protein
VQPRYPFVFSERAVKVGSIAFAMIAVSMASSASAEDASVDETFTMGHVEVVGVREAAATSLVTDTVTAETLAQKHRDDLSEALDLIPGVTTQNLGQRRERLISVRGFSSRQVPLFIDGVPVYVPYDGNVDLARFGVDYVSQIVVGKGLASLLYGPNILGGAVNVVSRKPTKSLEGSGRVSFEFDDELKSVDQRVVGSLGGINGNWYGHVTASYLNSDGYRLPSDFVPVAAEDGGNRENATSRDTVVSAKVGFMPDADNEYALSYYRQDGQKNDPPYAGSYLKTGARPDGVQVRYWDWPYWDKESVYLIARNAIGSKGTLRWRLFHDSFKNSLESYDDATYTTQTRPYAFHGSNYNDYTYGGNADFRWDWNDAQATTLAAHYRQDVHRESQIAPALPEQRLEIPTYDVAVEHEWRMTQSFALNASYSYMAQPEETVQVYNSNTKTFSPVSTDSANAHNAQLIGTYSFTSADSFVAGVSRKTRFPTLKERFSGGLGSVVPNPTLDSESALHYELSYQHKGANWSAKAALFQAKLNDAIQSVSLAATACSVPPCTQLQNIGEQRNRGIELSADYAPIDTLQLSGQINLLDIDNITSPTVLPTGVPKDKYLLSANWQFTSKWYLRVDGQHESERYSTSTGTRIAGAFTTLNGFVRFEPIAKLGVELGVRNATDELYAYEEGFYEAGRTWLAQVDYRF